MKHVLIFGAQKYVMNYGSGLVTIFVCICEALAFCSLRFAYTTNMFYY